MADIVYIERHPETKLIVEFDTLDSFKEWQDDLGMEMYEVAHDKRRDMYLCSEFSEHWLFFSSREAALDYYDTQFR